jgi:hypothetical protein
MRRIINICENEIRVEGRVLRIGRLEAEGYLFLEEPERVLEQLRQHGTGVDLFTFVQRLPETSQRLSYPMEWDNFAALRLTTFDEWWNKQIGFKARNKAKQSEKKGIVVREVPFSDTLVKGIWEVYNECSVRQGQRNRHYGKDFETVYKEEATFLDHSIFIGAFLGESLVGFIKLVHDDTRTQAGMMNVVSMVKHRDKAPANALVAQAVRSCSDRGIPYLVYSRFAYGKKQRSGLTDFKERNAFKQIDVPRYYVPLTTSGSLALRMGLHRRMVDYLPESVTSRLRDLRAAWHKRKLASVSEVS